MRRTALLIMTLTLAASSALAQERWWLAHSPVLAPAAGPASYLGVGVAEIDSSRAKELKLQVERGVEIRRVEADSPAEKAGLKERDVVLEYNGQPVEGTESFIRLVRETPVGRYARMLISREGATQTLTATLGRRKDGQEGHTYSFTIPPLPPIPPIDLPKLMTTLRTTRVGLETESLSEQLAEYFGVKEGVLVRSVDKDSPAEKAGIKAGDVILRIDGEKVRRPGSVSEELRSSWDKKTIPVDLVRNKKELTVNLEMPVSPGREFRRRAITVQRDRL